MSNSHLLHRTDVWWADGPSSCCHTPTATLCDLLSGQSSFS